MNEIRDFKLSNDTDITLSQIESGCLFIHDGDKTLMVIKSPQDVMNELKGLKGFSIRAELIERPEFPTVAAYFFIHTAGGHSHKFEYYFNIEASDELELLQKLSAQDSLEILLYEDQIVDSKIFPLTDEDRIMLSSLHTQARGLFDKD